MKEIKSVEFYKNKYPDCYVPDIEDFEEWIEDSGCETPSGAWVEADGYDDEGNPSWMLIFGLI
jgi:hypothetical protein